MIQLTKREQFAMAAMQGMLAAPPGKFLTQTDSNVLVREAVKAANALIEELEKRNE